MLYVLHTAKKSKTHQKWLFPATHNYWKDEQTTHVEMISSTQSFKQILLTFELIAMATGDYSSSTVNFMQL